MSHIRFAESADVHFHNIAEVNLNGTRLLWIKGLIMHSSVVADHIDLHHEKHAVHILVSMALAVRPGKSGLFELYIPIPDQISQVTFGKERAVLWASEQNNQDQPARQFANQNFG
ncbi:hypothetical protein [Pseudoduganella aquatica]|uniref:Uncharacterized protein n=1 Tax=Pseudoduganella aquatica TaxID=2660641 RepID=A0A7X4HCZ1_9BURK|nr:hypothetical protein [Pseudoduganella aquatica]MYN08898.1 hypothetical protein [Pseudoduganella aquatica]